MNGRVTPKRTIRGSVWVDGELMYETGLVFNRSQYDFILECVSTARLVAQDNEMSFSKCIEMFAGEFAATYGVIVDGKTVEVVGDLARRICRYAARSGVPGFDVTVDGSILVHEEVAGGG